MNLKTDGNKGRNRPYHHVFEVWEQEVTYDHHGDGEIGPQLVVTPGARRAVAVFVYAALVNQVGVLLVRVGRVFGHVEQLFEAVLYSSVPLVVGDGHCPSWTAVKDVAVGSGQQHPHTQLRQREPFQEVTHFWKRRGLRKGTSQKWKLIFHDITQKGSDRHKWSLRGFCLGHSYMLDGDLCWALRTRPTETCQTAKHTPTSKP